MDEASCGWSDSPPLTYRGRRSDEINAEGATVVRSDKAFRLSGWRDLNSRPLDPQAAQSAFLVVADGCTIQRLPLPAAHCADRATSGNLRQQAGLGGER
jgi:hypothetical protein